MEMVIIIKTDDKMVRETRKLITNRCNKKSKNIREIEIERERENYSKRGIMIGIKSGGDSAVIYLHSN